MANRTKEIGIRLSVKDKEIVERAFKEISAEGRAALGSIERAAKPASVSLNALNAAVRGGRSALGGFVAGAVAGLLPLLSLSAAINGTKAALDAFGDIADKSKSAGVDSEFFQGIAYQAKLAGVDISGVSSALDTFNKNSGAAAEGRGKMVTALKAEHAELLKGIQLATSQEARIRLVADALDQAKTSSERATIASAAFGDQGVAIAAAFEGGAAKIDAMLAKAKELGIIVDRDTIAKADELGDKFDTITTIIDIKLKKALINLGPALVDLTGLAADLVDAFAIVADQFRDIEQRTFLHPLQNELIGIENQITTLKEQMASGIAASKEGGLNGALFGWSDKAVADAKARMEDMYTAASALQERIAELQGKPSDTVTSETKTILKDPPPDLPLDDAAKAALKEAEALIKRLRTASEEYRDSVADLDAKRKAGLIGQDTYNRALAEAALKFAGAANGSEEFAQALADLDAAKARGIISEQQYTEAVEAMTKRRLIAENNWFAGVQLGLMQIQDGANDVTKSVGDAVESWANSLGDAIGSVFRTGKFEWKDLVTNILADIAKLATQQLITKPLGGLLSSLVGGLLGGGGGWNIPSSFVPGGFYPAFPGNAAGTDFWKGGPTWVGERGPEILNLPRGSQVIPNHKIGAAGMGAMTLNFSPVFNIDGSGLSEDALGRVLDDANRRMEERIPGIVKKAIKDGKL